MTTEQSEKVRILLGLLRGLLVAGGPIAGYLGMLLGKDMANHYVEIAAAVIGMLSTAYGVYWTVVASKDSSILSAATQVKGVDFTAGSIKVDTSRESDASASAKSAAFSNDPAFAGIQPKQTP